MADQKKQLSPSKKTGIATAVLAACLAAILHFEGSRHMPYQDLGGVWTVCRGHTGPDVIPGKSWTEEQCKAQDVKDLQVANDAVNSCALPFMTTGEQIAFTDFAYNVGGGAFCRSSMPGLINAGKNKEACKVILRYVYVGKIDCRTAGKKCPGIVRRRQWEYNKCMEG